MKYGIAINVEELKSHRKSYTIKAAELESKLLQVMPKVPYTDNQMVDMFLKLYWKKGGIMGLTNKAEAEKLIKKKVKHTITEMAWKWVEANKEKYAHPVNLAAPAQKLESFKRMGIKLSDTSEKVIKDYIMSNESIVLEQYLSYQKSSSLLKKVLEKIDYGKYLRTDNTVRSTFYWVNPLNGRSSSSELNCFSSDTQVLTRDGWKFFPDLIEGEEIIQYREGILEFVKPLNYIKKRDTILQIKNQHINLKVTPDHRCYLKSSFRGKEVYRDILAKDFPSYKYQHIHGGVYRGDGIEIKDSFLKLVVASQADGSFTSSGKLDFSFSKERKIIRLINILDSLNLSYTIDKSNIRTRIVLQDKEVVSKIKTYLPNKTFSNWILNLHTEQLQLFCYETLFWDGCDYRGRKGVKKGIGEYCSTIKQNSEWVQVAWSLIGKRALLKEQDQRDRSMGSLSYRVYITDTNYSGVENRSITEYEIQDVYCVSVPSSYILVKTDNCISISGQCQQLPRELKSLFGHPIGMKKIEVDLCLHPETELLTKRGWINVLDLTPQDFVWQVNPHTLQGSFVIPQRIIKKEYKGDMFWVGNNRGVIGVTRGHTMLYGAQKTKRNSFRRICKVEEGLKEGQSLITSSFSNLESFYDPLDIWRAVAIHDNGSILPYNRYSIQVIKDRKVEKLKELFGDPTYIRDKRDCHTGPTYTWTIRNFNTPLLDSKTKTLNLTTLGSNQAHILKEALEFFDGSPDHDNTTKYTSTDSITLDNIQAFFITSGYEARIRPIEITNKNPLWKQAYSLYIRKAKNIRLSSSNIRSEIYEGKVGCVTVPEGFIQVRHKGQTFITGNCAIEFFKLLNDYPEPELIKIMLSDQDDVHIFNASRFFNRDYQELLALHKAKDKETKNLRNAAKTVIYFLQYKTPKNPDERFVTGTAKLMEIFRTDLGWDLPKEEAEQLIIKGEAILKSWTKEKLAIDSDIKKIAEGKSNLTSKLLKHLKNSAEDIDNAHNEGIIYFRGAKNMYYKFDLLRDHIYTPEQEVWDESEETYKTKREYINSRSLYSCAIAGPIAIGAKEAVRRIQEDLYTKYGAEKARLNLFVHDSFTCYCEPSIAEEVKSIMIKHILEAVYDIAKFNTLPVSIEGGIEGQKEERWSYHGIEIFKA
jgi:hypothetical protein